MVDPGSGSAVIREYRPADLPLLEEMYATFEPRGGSKGLPPVREEKARRWLAHLGAHAHSLVAFPDCRETRVAGHVILAARGEADAELALFVHQDFRNRGVGSALTRAAIRASRALGYKRLWLTVSPDNRPAIGVYQKCGFIMIPGRCFPDHEMELRLE